jgi:hypothetical protein
MHNLFLRKTKFVLLCKGNPHPEICTLGAEDFICFGLERRGRSRFPLSLSGYLFGVKYGKRDAINQSINMARTSSIEH